MFFKSFLSRKFANSPFADPDAVYTVMEYDEAARRYAVFSDDSVFSAEKEYTLHSGGAAEKQTAAFRHFNGRHLLKLRNAYIVEEIGVYTEDGFFLPAEYTAIFGAKEGRFTLNGNEILLHRKRWERLARKRDVETVRGPLFYGDSNWQGYGHFLLEALPRCWALGKLPSKKIRVSSGFKLKREFYRQCLPALDYPENRVKRTDGVTFCKSLYVSTLPVFIQRYVYPEARDVWKRIGKYYKDHKKTAGPYKLFISRANVERRTLHNQHEIEDIFRKFGFTIYHPQEDSLAEQAHMFANASHVACLYGSAMFNALFAQRPVSMLIFGHNKQFFDHFPYFDDSHTIDAVIDDSSVYDNKASIYYKDWRIGNLDYCRNVIDAWFHNGKL